MKLPRLLTSPLQSIKGRVITRFKSAESFYEFGPLFEERSPFGQKAIRRMFTAVRAPEFTTETRNLLHAEESAAQNPLLRGAIDDLGVAKFETQIGNGRHSDAIRLAAARDMLDIEMDEARHTSRSKAAQILKARKREGTVVPDTIEFKIGR